MGLACQGAGDAAGARRHFRRELEIDPGNAQVRSLIEALETSRR
jgi:Flp pilus assembly protein TadD